MERTKLLTFSVIALLLLNLLTIGFVFVKSDFFPLSNERHGPLPSREGPARIIIERLHFDEGQQQQYWKMVRQHQEKTRQLNDESVQLFRAYYHLLSEPQPDSVKEQALTQKIADNQRQQAEVNFAHFQKIKALCRPDQQAYFTQLVDELARLFGQRQRSPGRPGHEPPGGRPDGPPENFPPRQ
ncbi:periplasmic heavy metal sensor [Spirosoma gilvum]